jgi:hypothetical protein
MLHVFKMYTLLIRDISWEDPASCTYEKLRFYSILVFPIKTAPLPRINLSIITNINSDN